MSISDKFNEVDTVKAQIKRAIMSKGVPVTSEDNFASYPQKIRQIEGGGSSLLIGQIISSTLPLTDAGLHLLDGALLAYGSYSEFIDYMADLYDSGDYTDLFETEADWQTAVTTYGVCGKFVYDSVNNTVRLPKYSNKIYTKEITSIAPVVGNGKALKFYDGSDTLNLGNRRGYDGTAHFGGNSSNIGNGVSSNNGTNTVTSYAVGLVTSASDSGVIAQLSNITTSLDGYYYIVLATTTKTDIQVDIDEIATDLNGKADVDLTNVNNSGTSRGAGWGFPSDKDSAKINLTLGVTNTDYTAPANGYYVLCMKSSAAGQLIAMGSAGKVSITDATNQKWYGDIWTSAGADQLVFGIFPALKGDIVNIDYTCPSSNLLYFRFIYAVGSESEA